MLRHRRELGVDGLKQIFNRNSLKLGDDQPGFQLRNIEQRVEQLSERMDGHRQEIADRLLLFIQLGTAQGVAKKVDRLNRLAQIVAGRSEKSRLGQIGALRLLFCHQKFRFGALALGDIRLGDDVANNPPDAIRLRSHLADHMRHLAIRTNEPILADEGVLWPGCFTPDFGELLPVVRVHKFRPLLADQLFEASSGQRTMPAVNKGVAAVFVKVRDADRDELRQLAELRLALRQVIKDARFANPHAPQAADQDADQAKQQER